MFGSVLVVGGGVGGTTEAALPVVVIVDVVKNIKMASVLLLWPVVAGTAAVAVALYLVPGNEFLLPLTEKSIPY